MIYPCKLMIYPCKLRLEILSVKTCWEVPGIESLKRMGKLRKVELRANKGSSIERCIGTIENWPDEIIIYAGTVPDASSVIDSFKLGLSTSLSVVDSFSNKDISSRPELCSPNSSAIMLCYIINGAASSLQLYSGCRVSYLEIGEGRWALIGVFAQHSGRFYFSFRGEGIVEVERGLAVRGEKKMLVEALLPLLQSIWS